MIAYTILGTNNLVKSAAFYDALLGEVGCKRALEIPRVILYQGKEGTPFFCIAEPADGEPATAGNGTMISLGAGSKEEVDRLYSRAIELGANDEGKPGPRKNGALEFYAGYFRDPDGNKLNFFHM